MSATESPRSFASTLRAFTQGRVVAMLFLGFSAGLPILLIFSSLSLWLREAGLAKSSVTMFSWAALGYSFKFVWAPLVDRLPLPLLSRLLGRRRGWLLISQFAVIGAIVMMALTDPVLGNNALILMALGAVALGFSSATQDIVIDAYRIESGSARDQALMSSTYIAGYRIGMLVAGAGALFLAEHYGSTKDAYSFAAWSKTYLIMAACMLIGVVTTLLVPEPDHPIESGKRQWQSSHYIRFLLLFASMVLAFIGIYVLTSDIGEAWKTSLRESTGNRSLASFIVNTCRLIAGIGGASMAAVILVASRVVDRQMVNETYIAPVRDFFSRYGGQTAVLLICLIGSYRISDIVLGAISNVFYQDLGFEKSEIALAVKTFGLFAAIFGGFVGGVLSLRFGVMWVMLVGAILAAGTNLLFMLLSATGDSAFMLYAVVLADNLSAGIASAAFVAFLSALTNIRFTAMQYAIFSSIMTLFPKILGGYSGAMVESMGYANFFGMTALLGVPVIVLVVVARKMLDVE